MNDKEKLFYHVVETAARYCSYTLKDGQQSITVADVLGKSRRENVQLTRNIAVGLLVALGFTVSTCAVMMHRSPPAIRCMMRADRQMQETSHFTDWHRDRRGASAGASGRREKRRKETRKKHERSLTRK